MTSLRIVQLANFYGPTSGGLRVCVDQLGKRYVDAGHRVMLVIPGQRDDRHRVGRHTVVTLESPRLPGLGDYRAVIDVRTVREILRNFQPDVIELSDKLTMPRAIAPRAVTGGPRGPGTARHGPVSVLISHERFDAVIGSQLPRRLPVGRAVARLNRMALSRVDAVVCASQYAAQEFAALGVTQPVVRIPLGVDLDTFHPDRRLEAPPRNVDTPEVLYVGRLSPEKRPDLAIDTIRQLQARRQFVRLRIVGTGPLEGSLRRAAEGLPVEFVGQVTDRLQLARMIASADAVLSTGPHETFGLSALEALACGTPVVANPSGALRELMAIGAGIVAGQRPEGFAEALALLLLDDRTEQRRAARARAEQFGWQRTASSFMDLYQSLLTGGADPAPAEEHSSVF
jgi:alpha-1,6-mannosyltransferase